MKFACLIYIEDKKHEPSEADLAAIVEACHAAAAWKAEIDDAGHHVFSGGLQSVRTAKTVRHLNGKLSITDGPFAETKEFLGGFTVIEADDLSQAVALAAKFPPQIGKVEVRPLVDPNIESTDLLDRRISAGVRQSHA